MQVGVDTKSGQVGLTDGVIRAELVVRSGGGLVVVADADGRLQVHRSMDITIQGSGFKPRSFVTVSLVPGGKALGTFQTDENGNFSSNVKLPRSMSLGGHNVKLHGVDESGNVRDVAFGLEVVSDDVALDAMRPVATLSLAGINPLGMLAAFGLFTMFWLVIGRRRGERTDYPDYFRLTH